jgi:hypothetical protein
MNSLTELNGYVNSLSLEYTDQRYARVIFDRAAAENQTKIVNEGETFFLSIGIEILEVINYAISDPTLTINIGSVYDEGVRVQWDSLPTGVTVDSDSNGLYVVNGIVSKAVWDQVKLAKIVLPTNVPDAFFGNWTYDVDIDYVDANLGSLNQDYTVAVSVLDVTFMTTPIEFVYESDTNNVIANTPQLASYLDTDYPGATWTMTATVSLGLSIDNFNTTYTSGGTFTYNPSTKGFTIVGTRAQVNGHLAALRVDTNSLEIDFIIYYVLSNNQDSTTDSKSQNLINENIQYFSNLTETTFSYTEDTETEIVGYPQITDLSYVGSGLYTVTIYASEPNYIYTLRSTGPSGVSSFSSSTKTLTLVGTKANINTHLQNIFIQPESDVDVNFQLFYDLETPIGARSIKTMQLICGSNDTEVQNINVTRTYIGNRTNVLFPSTLPAITDFDSTGTNTYTITLQSTLGSFGTDDVSYVNPWSYTGTKEQVNAVFSTIKFYPNKDVSSNGTVSYTQIKNSVTQVSTTFALNGTAGVFQNPRTVLFSNTQTFTPTLEDILYSKFAVMLVGAGGGGGRLGGGGGGGGEGVYYFDQTFSNTTYTATVGVGGAGGVTSDGGDGTNSTFAGLTARAGKGGKQFGGAGGASGNENSGGAGTQDSSFRFWGGGGGGRSSGGQNATTTKAGDGGIDTWSYVNRLGVTVGPNSSNSGSGGGGGSATSSGRGQGGDVQSASSGDGATTAQAAVPGDPRADTSIASPQYAGNGGGGGANSGFTSGAAGANGLISLEIY